MNNILPSDVPVHEKYDLKGSLYKRKASRTERAKAHPTFKDLDFLEQHPDGLQLEEKDYDNIISSIRRDCMVCLCFDRVFIFRVRQSRILNGQVYE
jgi:1-phosphatidylinositol-4-phosphate 5-kinase